MLGHSDYHYRTRTSSTAGSPAPAGPAAAGIKGSRWYGDNAQTSVFFVDRPSRSAEHPTMKPVALIEQMLANSSRRGDIVLDPFAGSGSTLDRLRAARPPLLRGRARPPLLRRDPAPLPGVHRWPRLSEACIEPGRAAIDWQQAFLFYAGLPPQQRTYQAVADQFGVSVRTVERHGMNEHWQDKTGRSTRRRSRQPPRRSAVPARPDRRCPEADRGVLLALRAAAQRRHRPRHGRRPPAPVQAPAPNSGQSPTHAVRRQRSASSRGAGAARAHARGAPRPLRVRRHSTRTDNEGGPHDRRAGPS